MLQDWREKVGVGSILEQPQPFFDFAKNMYMHGLVCFTKNGAPVWLDKVGDMKRDWAGFKVCGDAFLRMAGRDLCEAKPVDKLRASSGPLQQSALTQLVV